MEGVEKEQRFQTVPQSERDIIKNKEKINNVSVEPIQIEDQSKGLGVIRVIRFLFLIGMIAFLFNLNAKIDQKFQALKEINPFTNLPNKVDEIRKKMNDQAEDIDRASNKTNEILQKISLKAGFLFDRSKEIYFSERINIIKELAKNDKFLSSNENAKILFLNSMRNIKLAHQNVFFQREVAQKQKVMQQRLKKQYNFQIPEESFCVIVPTKNNIERFRHQYVLQSVFIQDYNNYKVIVISDSIKPQELQLFQQYVKENSIKQPVSYVLGKDKGNTLSHIYTAVTEHCSPQDNAIVLEESGELLGRYVLKVFNSVYSQSKAEALYSNSLIYDITKNSISSGQSSAYTEEEKANSQYHKKQTKTGPLRSFKVKNFLKIPTSDLKDKDGQFIGEGYEQILYPQILELSCEKNQLINEFVYLIEVEAGKKERTPSETKEKIANQLRAQKRHTCKK